MGNSNYTQWPFCASGITFIFHELRCPLQDIFYWHWKMSGGCRKMTKYYYHHYLSWFRYRKGHSVVAILADSNSNSGALTAGTEMSNWGERKESGTEWNGWVNGWMDGWMNGWWKRAADGIAELYVLYMYYITHPSYSRIPFAGYPRRRVWSGAAYWKANHTTKYWS